MTKFDLLYIIGAVIRLPRPEVIEMTEQFGEGAVQLYGTQGGGTAVTKDSGPVSGFIFVQPPAGHEDLSVGSDVPHDWGVQRAERIIVPSAVADCGCICHAEDGTPCFHDVVEYLRRQQ